MNEGVRRVLEGLRASRVAELKGARVFAAVPLSERLLNDLLTAALPASLVVRDVTVHPKADNRILVRGRLTQAAFLPPLSLTMEIEQQPELPDGPLVLRVLSLPGLVSLAGAALPIASMLPPGVRFEQQRILVNVRILLERAGLSEVVPLIETLKIKSEEGRLVADVGVRV